MCGYLKNLLFPLLLMLAYPIKAQVPSESNLNSSSKISNAPEESRFQKVELASNLDEPMELAVLPSGNILFIERKGGIKLFDSDKNQVKLLTYLNVFHGIEDGLLGLTLDPYYKENNYIYLYYSPLGDKETQRVGRFILNDDKLDLSSEKTIIEIPTQRKECCHSAGSITFGPNKTLYIAIGDNTNPHNEGYYNSIDERKGREYWDAQRTAGNTNDFRGKILRIKPENDGSYSIPDGNLFPKDGSKGKPEIYAMGCRNPYRISVDQKTGYLYWGDVGQNTENNPSRGPISYDEFHQAKKPGFFGWPYFAGNNQPYTHFDFETGVNGPFYNPEHPINKSPNNTGEVDLPPAQGAFIWYSYDESKEFKNLGTGGKSPIAGPVFYSELYKQTPEWLKTPRKFPDYYNGKLFIAEWMRDWINTVTMDKDGNLINIERFLPSAKFDHPIDLEFGPDGALYVLEYGTAWFAQNKNSKLVRIEYNPGNRPPVAIIEADKTIGAAPLAVKFSANNSYDHDKGDTLKYLWESNFKNKIKSSGSSSQFVFTSPGIYKINLTVTDNHGLSTIAEKEIFVGNEKPQVDLIIDGNQTFYRSGQPVKYQVKVKDKEDGSLENGKIDPKNVIVTLDKIDMGTDLTFVTQNQEKAISNYFHPGLELINKSDCKSCHQLDAPSIGPSYKKVAVRYKDDKEAINVLSDKIIKGGNGKWGETAMSAHPQLRKEETMEIVKYILTLANEAEVKNLMPVKGSFTPKDNEENSYLFTVMYKDKGVGAAPSQTTKRVYVIRNTKISAISCNDYKEVEKFNNELVKFNHSGSFISFKNFDLTGLKEVIYSISARQPGRLEVHLGSPDGPIVSLLDFLPNIQSSKSVDASKKDEFSSNVNAPLKETKGIHDVYFIYKDVKGTKENTWNGVELQWITFK